MIAYGYVEKCVSKFRHKKQQSFCTEFDKESFWLWWAAYRFKNAVAVVVFTPTPSPRSAIFTLASKSFFGGQGLEPLSVRVRSACLDPNHVRVHFRITTNILASTAFFLVKLYEASTEKLRWSGWEGGNDAEGQALAVAVQSICFQ